MLRAIGFTLLLGATSVRADVQATPEAQRHIDAGVAAFNAKDYDTASHEFEIAYDLVPLPKVLFGWAQARRLGDHCDEAIPLYRRYLATKPNDEQIEAATTAMLLCQRADAPDPVVVTVTRPPELVVRHELQPWYRDKVGGVLVAGGVATLSVGVTFLVLASHSEDAATRAPKRDEFLDLLDETTLRRRIGWAGVGVGAGLLAGAIARYVVHDEFVRVEVSGADRSVALSTRF